MLRLSSTSSMSAAAAAASCAASSFFGGGDSLLCGVYAQLPDVSGFVRGAELGGSGGSVVDDGGCSGRRGSVTVWVIE
jgi:hypothetical protein